MGLYNVAEYGHGSVCVLKWELEHTGVFQSEQAIPEANQLLEFDYQWSPLCVGYQRNVPCLWFLCEKRADGVSQHLIHDTVAAPLVWALAHEKMRLVFLETGELASFPQDRPVFKLGSMFTPPDATGYQYISHAFMWSEGVPTGRIFQSPGLIVPKR